MADIKENIAEALKKKKALIGTRSVMKALKRGELTMVVYASNTPDGFKRDLERCAGVSKAEVGGFKGDSSKLGELCGRPFNILMVGIKK